MPEPILCGHISVAPLLPKLRGHFAEFLDNASPAGLGILSPSTCVGLRYGYGMNDSGFSRYMAHMLRYYSSLRITPLGCVTDLPFTPLLRLHRFFLSRLMLSTYVPTVLSYHSAGISTCCPSATSFDLALGPDLPRADQLYPGNLRYSADRILTYLSLLIPAFSLHTCPLLLSVQLLPGADAPLPVWHTPHPTASAACFSPGHFRRRDSRLVSCYALFECMAASEPTS